MRKKTKRRIIWGIGIGLIILVIAYSLQPPLKVTDVFPAMNIKQEISLQDEEAIKAVENNYTIVFKGTKLWRYPFGYYDISLKDDKGRQISITEAETPDSSKSGAHAISFIGKPNTSYTLSLTYEGRYQDDERSEITTTFKTPKTNDTLKTALQEINKAVSKNLKNELKEQLAASVNREEIWVNMSPYYTPNKEEKEAIATAYWDTFIKDVSNFNLVLTKADSIEYELKLTYQTSKPDIANLNQRIEDRENVLKTELGGDNKKMFQTIVKELPNMIKQTPSLPQDDNKEERINLNISRSSFKNGKLDEESDNFLDFGHNSDSYLNELYP